MLIKGLIMTNKSVANSLPTANIAVNKSRLKIYEKTSDVPTYYLQKGQEFQIELFNPTKNAIMVKISLNSRPISQGGLVLRQGERVFLDRYLDVAKKFKFDTYEVENSEEAIKAIEDNGDFKVEFYDEIVQPLTNNWNYLDWTYRTPNSWGGDFNTLNSYNQKIGTTLDFGATQLNASLTTSSLSSTIGGQSLRSAETPRRRLLKSKSIETGRVEQGSTSEQKLQTVDMKFNSYPFHTVKYKLLPVSQKVNTTEDIKVAMYCTNCGTKQKPTNKFCPICGTKQ
jgi:hypothetical protein